MKKETSEIEVKKRIPIEVKKRSKKELPDIEVRKIPKSLDEVKAIGGYQIPLNKKEDLKKLIEYPLLSACEEFYDKNIQTTYSSANRNHLKTERGVVAPAQIIIDYDSLSEQNKTIALKNGRLHVKNKKGSEKFNIPNKTIPEIIIEIPIGLSDTVSDIKKKAENIAHQFKKQPMTWAKTDTLENIKKSYCVEDDISAMSIAKELGYYYNSKDKLFYMSKEQYDKSHEIIVSRRKK